MSINSRTRFLSAGPSADSVDDGEAQSAQSDINPYKDTGSALSSIRKRSRETQKNKASRFAGVRESSSSSQVPNDDDDNADDEDKDAVGTDDEEEQPGGGGGFEKIEGFPPSKKSKKSVDPLDIPAFMRTPFEPDFPPKLMTSPMGFDNRPAPPRRPGRMPGEMTFTPGQSSSYIEYAFPITRSDVETLRGWATQDNQEMEAIRSDPFYKFAVLVAQKCQMRTSTWLVRNEYREYLKEHGKLGNGPLANAQRLAEFVSKVLPNADLIYDPELQEPRDPNGATLSESVRRELMHSIQFMNKRQQALESLRELGHHSGYRGKQLFTDDLNAMVDNALMVMRGMARNGSWNDVSIDDIVASEDARPLFASLIAYEQNIATDHSGKRSFLHAHLARVKSDRAACIRRLLSVNLRRTYGRAMLGLTSAGNPIPMMDL